jgi:hypothetical protein
MSESERYVAYYRMPAIGDMPNGNSLARQRLDLATFLDHPDRVLVGEFTEVLTPSVEGETSPAFDLGLECCRNLDATLICAVPKSELAPAAREKADTENIEIRMVGGAVSSSGGRPESLSDNETVPYLRFGEHRRHAVPAPWPVPGEGPSPAGNRVKADQFAAAVLPIIDQIRANGATTLTDIAEVLNARNIRTARGGRWYPTTVKNILDRRD